MDRFLIGSENLSLNAKEEFTELCRSSGSTVGAEVFGKIDKPTSNYFIKAGKVEEIKALVKELSADLVDMGLTMTGSGSLLKNIDKRFSKETGLPVHIADDPLACVAIGTGKALDQEETFSSMLTEY